MSKRNRERRERNRAANNPGTQYESGPERARRLLDVPAPVDYVELPHISACPDPNPDPAPPPPETATGGSRANSLRSALRARILFPLSVKEEIDKLFREFSIDLHPEGSLSEWLVYEMSRSKTQADLASDKLILDELRVVERAGTAFESDQALRATTLGARLSKQPQLVAGALEATKAGTLYLIRKYEFLYDLVQSNAGLDSKQLDVLADLMGIDTVYRLGSSRIPAGTDAPRLTSLIACELRRLRANLPALCDRSDAEKGMAMLGIVSAHDSTTRILRADRNRARARFNWAFKVLKELQAGANPADIEDPSTRRPVAAGPLPTAVPDRAPPAAAAPPPPEPPQPPPPAPAAAPAIAPLPEGLSDVAREMFLVTAGAILNKMTPPAADVTGPPPTA